MSTNQDKIIVQMYCQFSKNGFPRMDFREWIFKVGIDTAENDLQQVVENCYSLR